MKGADMIQNTKATENTKLLVGDEKTYSKLIGGREKERNRFWKNVLNKGMWKKMKRAQVKVITFCSSKVILLVPLPI